MSPTKLPRGAGEDHAAGASPWKHATTVLLLEQMGVRAGDRSRGAGSALLAAVWSAAAARGISDVRLHVWGFNAGARTFYARHGFEPYQEQWWLTKD